MKKVIIATLLFTMLHSCMGCSDSQSDMELIPVHGKNTWLRIW